MPYNPLSMTHLGAYVLLIWGVAVVASSSLSRKPDTSTSAKHITHFEHVRADISCLYLFIDHILSCVHT